MRTNYCAAGLLLALLPMLAGCYYTVDVTALSASGEPLSGYLVQSQPPESPSDATQHGVKTGPDGSATISIYKPPLMRSPTRNVYFRDLDGVWWMTIALVLTEETSFATVREPYQGNRETVMFVVDSLSDQPLPQHNEHARPVYLVRYFNRTTARESQTAPGFLITTR